MNTIRNTLVALMMAVGLIGVVPLTEVGAINALDNACKGNAGSPLCAPKSKGETIDPLIKNIIRILLTVLGAIAVIMIIVGGIKYVVSDGDASKIQSAKNTILYSVVGLVVALLSYAIVEFVLSYF